MNTLIRNTLKNMIPVLMSFFIVFTVNAQKIDCAEIVEIDPNELPSLLLTEIAENDYQYFLNVMSLKKYSNISYGGLPVKCYKNRNYKMTSNANNIILDVTYGDDGSLIKGSLVKIDKYLPLVIMNHLPAYRVDRWQMISNKTFINDFDPFKTEYEVVLQRDNKKKTLFFDYSGKQIKRLHRS